MMKSRLGCVAALMSAVALRGRSRVGQGSMSDEFQVLWTAQGLVADVVGEVLAKRAVFEE